MVQIYYYKAVAPQLFALHTPRHIDRYIYHSKHSHRPTLQCCGAQLVRGYTTGGANQTDARLKSIGLTKDAGFINKKYGSNGVFQKSGYPKWMIYIDKSH